VKVEPDEPVFLDSLGWAYVQAGKLVWPIHRSRRGRQAAKTGESRNISRSAPEAEPPRRPIAAWQRALAGDGEALDRAKGAEEDRGCT